MHDTSMKKYVFFTLFLVASAFAIIMLWPFLTIIIFSLVLAAALYPVYTFFFKKITRRISWLAALSTVLFFIVSIAIPLFFVGSIIFSQSQHLAQWLTQQGGIDSVALLINHAISQVVPIGVDVSNSITTIISHAGASLGSVFSSTVSGFFSLLLVMLCLFYLLKDGAQWKEFLLRVSPFSEDINHTIITRMVSAVRGIIRGYFFVGLAQGVLVAVGMYIFDVPHAALWGTFAGITSLIPTIGTAFITIPAVLFLMSTGAITSAIGLAIWSAALVGTIDNILNPFIVGRSIAIHPVLVLFSALGGISLMGPLGILIGPLVISFVYTLVSVYKSSVE